MRALDYMQKKLAESFSESWGNREQLRSEIVDLSEDSSTGTIGGKLAFLIGTRSGEQKLALEQAFEGLRTRDDVDDFLAESLSTLLSVHTSWPR